MKIKFTLFLLLTGIYFGANSQQLMTENFDYTSGSPLTANGWTMIPSTILPISTTNAGLTFAGYALSGIGNAAKIDTTGQDIYRDLYRNITSGNLYTSFMLNVNKANVVEDYFFAYLPQNSTSLFSARLVIKLASANSNYYKICVSKGSETKVYSADSFPLNTTSLVVVKYQFTDGALNDTVSLYNFTTSMPSIEPTPIIFTSGGTTADATSLGRLALRQGSAASAPRVIIDGIRTATSWAELNTPTSKIQPSHFTVTASNTTTASTKISWTKNTNYIDSTMTTLVFVKPINTINIGTPTLSANAYMPNTNFALSSSFYQNDVAAKCVLVSDSNNVTITGLNQNVLYQILVLTVRDLDSAYAIATNGSMTTLSSAPRAITGLNITAVGQHDATINWTRPTGYNATTNSILVYVKPITNITAGLPNTNPILINADSNFNGLGSLLSLDSNARCIFKGDTTKVTVTGLNPAVSYYIAAYAVNDIDSNYSPSISGTFKTNSLGPLSVKLANMVSFTSNSSKISWTKDTSYNNANFTTLVFLKQGSAITQGTPSMDITSILANDNFMLGSVYQNDTAAYCIYKGDSSFAMPTNLAPATTYFALIYVVSNADSLYSNSVTATGTTRGLPPNNVSAITVAGINTTSTKISWTKPVGYANTGFTTLVFLKAYSAANAGTPTKTVNYYNANANFSSTFSTRFQNDTAAKCVYKGDTNYVNITAINNYTNYYVLVYVIRDADSTYSINSAIGNGTAAPNLQAPAYYTISQIDGINSTTGVPDSLNIRVALRGVVYGINQRLSFQGGMQFLLRDNTGGITIYNTASTLNYTPTEGDSILVFGIVSSNRGLLSLITLDSLNVLGSGKTLSMPKVVTKLSEVTENDLVRVNMVKFITKPAGTTWAAGSTYQLLTQNNDTVTARIYFTSAISGTAFPTSTYFSIIGLGTQVSNTAAPYAFTGYQILPRYAADIIEYKPLSTFSFVNPTNNANVKIEGDTAQKLNFTWTKSIHDIAISAPTYNVLVDSINGTFKNPIASFQSVNNGLDTNWAPTYSQIRSLITSLGITPNQSISLRFKINAFADFYTMNSDTITVNFTLGYMVGIQNTLKTNLLVYPNPVSDKLSIQLPENLGKTTKVEIMDLTGKVLITENVNTVGLTEIDIACQSLNKGIYFVRLQSEQLILTKKILKD